MIKLKHYEKLIGKQEVKKIRKMAEPLKGKHFIHVNSTYYGGGVAEMLTSLVPLFNDIGVITGWRIIKGNPDFFTITKKFHNALQGEDINLTSIKKKVFETVNKSNAEFTHISEHDGIIIHDPQPLPFINNYTKKQPWIWRCHIDLSDPNKELWKYLKTFIMKYDATIVSRKQFKHDLKIPQYVMPPSIDPLSPKNMEISETKINKYLKKFDIPRDKPIISQISRFDKWKDPLGVVKAFNIVRKKVDSRLVLLGSMATDDPEGQEIYDQVIKETNGDEGIHVINFENNILVNAVQRASFVVVQKSIKEGFGLTVSEALWKEKPVVASNVGGISLQVKNGVNGYLVEDYEECGEAIIKLLKNPKRAEKMGKKGRGIVRDNFLITRHLQDYIKIFKKEVINYKV